MAKIEIYDSGNIAGIRRIAIWLSEYSSDKQGSDKQGRILLSPDLATSDEVDFHVDNLIEQLNKARRRAKRLILEVVP